MRLPLEFRKEYRETLSQQPARSSAVQGGNAQQHTPWKAAKAPAPAQPATPAPSRPQQPSRRSEADAEAAALQGAAALLQRVAEQTHGMSTADVLRQLGVAPDGGAKPAAGGDTVTDRAAALRAMQQLQQTSSKPSKPAPKPPGLVITPEETAAFETFMRGIDADAPEEDFDAAAAYLDKLRRVAAHERSGGGASSPTAKSSTSTSDRVVPQTEKERQFVTALTAVARVLDEAGLPWFITCGTALGAVREGRFIAHDNDIDIGFFFQHLTSPSTPSSNGAELRPAEDMELPETDAAAFDVTQQRIMDVVTALATSPDLMVFDVLGEAAKGFQLRLRHTNGVLVDVNAYYVGLDTADGGRPFVWTATHYAESAKRRHGMYRYRNSFPLQLKRLPWFYDLGPHRVLCPTEQYLVEYFGADWRTPKTYDYDAGVAGEYRNIIPE